MLAPPSCDLYSAWVRIGHSLFGLLSHYNAEKGAINECPTLSRAKYSALLKLGNVELLPERVTTDIYTAAPSTPCPACQHDARRVHSHYRRTLADLPLAYTPLWLHLHVRRFFCDNQDCPRRTFSEPVHALTTRSARRTTRLSREQRHLGLDVGGESGARLARRPGYGSQCRYAPSPRPAGACGPNSKAPPPRHRRFCAAQRPGVRYHLGRPPNTSTG